jgi:sugar phosphate isomerase/epimerase
MMLAVTAHPARSRSEGESIMRGTSPSTRRHFLKATGSTWALLGMGLGLGRTLGADEPSPAKKRKMTIDLVCGNLGVRVDLPAAMALAQTHGFESLAPDAGYLGKRSDSQVQELRDDLKARGLTWGATGLPVDFRGDEAIFRSGMKSLPDFARALERAGATRVGTWIKPGHDRLTYNANFRQHSQRLGEVSRILGDHKLRLGLEYVGPKTSWTAVRFPFIHTMAEMKELIAEIGGDNVGLVLDSWHWYNAGETAADIRSLSALEVVACDLNDAPAQIPLDQQRDLVRELPGATGIIDLKGFLSALVAIGYDGPVRAEPFNATLRTMPPDAAVATTARAMKRSFALVG